MHFVYGQIISNSFVYSFTTTGPKKTQEKQQKLKEKKHFLCHCSRLPKRELTLILCDLHSNTHSLNANILDTCKSTF